MDLNQCIKTFVEVIEQNGFAAAARKRHRSAPQISKEISWLEDELKVQLLTRTTRKLSLTEAGEKFYRYAKHALGDYQTIKNELQDQQHKIAGPLSISLPVALGETIMSKLATAFLQQYPEIELTWELSNRFVDLHAEKIDIAIRADPSANLAYQFVPLMKATRHVYGSPEYFEKYGIPTTPDDLKHHNCLLHNEQLTPNQWPFKNNQLVIVKGNYKTNNCINLVNAAVTGIGLIYLSHHNVADKAQAKNPQLISVLCDYAKEAKSLEICYIKQDFVPKKIQAFIDFSRKSPIFLA